MQQRDAHPRIDWTRALREAGIPDVIGRADAITRGRTRSAAKAEAAKPSAKRSNTKQGRFPSAKHSTD